MAKDTQDAYGAAMTAVETSITDGIASGVLDEVDVMTAVFESLADGCTCGKHDDENAARFQHLHRLLLDLEEEWPLA